MPSIASEPSIELLHVLENCCKCQGLYYLRFKPLYQDWSCGISSAVKWWRESRETGKRYKLKNSEFVTSCVCCKSYSEWKVAHSVLAKQLESIADTQMYYILCAEEFVEVLNGDEYISYRGTNWALNGAPKGACSGEATVTGSIDILDYVTGIGNEIARTNHSVQTPAARQCWSI